LHESEEEMEILVSQEHSAFQELKEDSLALEHQRKQLDDQRALLDLERAELEQRLAELKLQYAFLDALSRHLDLREAALASDYEAVRMTGNRLSPRLARR
jgi:peptidoglycan hydrolase CwlO-like protein